MKNEELEERLNVQASVIRRLMDGLFNHRTQEREIETLRSQLNGDVLDSPEIFFATPRQGDRIEKRLDYLVEQILKRQSLHSRSKYPIHPDLGFYG
jgi:uncharacterized coiled-coil protein SlyX